jgi:uncharacterized protein DUF4129
MIATRPQSSATSNQQHGSPRSAICDLRSTARHAIVTLAVIALGLGARAAPAPISLDQYVGSLRHIRVYLAASQFAEAKSEAGRLKGAVVAWRGGHMHADDSLLDDVARVTRADHQLLLRIDTTLAEIRDSGAGKGGRADPKLLQKVAAEQDVPELAPGGEVPTKIKADIPLLEQIARSIADIFDWLSEKLGRLLDWFFDLFPRSDPRVPQRASGIRGLVYAVVAAIVLAIILLAWSVLRRSKKGTAAVETSEEFGSKRDEDPLSRGATEWERYAMQLAAAGRFREAIRAWYHAVLVTCYAGGVLHFRKGRTNWEYVSTLAPSLAWRPEMILLTRRFEREWYGADESSRDALDDCGARARAILESVREGGEA